VRTHGAKKPVAFEEKEFKRTRISFAGLAYAPVAVAGCTRLAVATKGVSNEIIDRRISAFK